MQHLEVSGAVRPLKWPLGVKWLKTKIKSSDFVARRRFNAGAIQVTACWTFDFN